VGSWTDNNFRKGEPEYDVEYNQLKRITRVQLKRTGLHGFHVQNGAKMVPFAGYLMPLSYGDVGQGMIAHRDLYIGIHYIFNSCQS
jgi:alpha-D-ribose 1-methylphosphonate 5-phosphate C-P lyase